MSFIKGKFYVCVIAPPGGVLTVGKIYECRGASGGAVDVRNDSGVVDWYSENRFDPTPIDTSTGVVCSCGTRAEKKIFATFEYWYCQKCKVEVGGKGEAEKRPPSRPWPAGSFAEILAAAFPLPDTSPTGKP